MANNSHNFTDTWLKSLSLPTEGRVEYWDDGCKGLKLRIGKRGKSWYVWGRTKTPKGLEAKPFHHKIGEYPSIGLSDARDEAIDIFRDARKNIHPTEKVAKEIKERFEAEKIAKKIAQKQSRELFINVAAKYIEHAKEVKRTWCEDQRILNLDFIPAWEDRTLDDIETIEVSLILKKIAERAKVSKQSSTNRGSPMANRSLACLRKMYNWAIANGYATRSPVIRGIALREQGNTQKRDFSNQELRFIWSACEALPKHAVPAVRMLMVSGQRLSVITGMRHSEIDREKGLWTIPSDAVGRSKNKLDHIVPLTDLMLQLIDSMDKIEGVDHVFCSHHRGDKALRLGSKLKALINAKCGFSDWEYKSLRQLVITRMRRKPLRIDRDIVDRVEGRLPRDVQSKHYDCNDYLEDKTEALKRWNRHLLEILNVFELKAGGGVVSLRGAS